MNESIHGERTASELQDRVTELIEQQTAISEVLRAIASSPHDLQPIFDAILDSATRLCRADAGSLRLSEEGGLRLAAVRGHPLLVSQVSSSFPVLAEQGSFLSRIAKSRLPTHIPDITVFEGDLRDDYWIAVVNAGIRTGLLVPLFKDNEIVGTITLGRKQVQPFSDKQISLFGDFAAQATIALESTRRERQYREAQMALAHANRVATMGPLTASITHEVNQPIAATITNAEAALRWLHAGSLHLDQVQQSLTSIVEDATRAAEVVDRIRALMKKAPPRKDRLEINGVILEIIELTHGEAVKYGISVSTELADHLPPVEADRVQLQQVLLNLIVNALEAMGAAKEGPRELLISTGKAESSGVLVAVQDSGPGLEAAMLEQVFESFYTTKPTGLGLGLSICRSITEAHGGRLWASTNQRQGATFHFTLPA